MKWNKIWLFFFSFPLLMALTWPINKTITPKNYEPCSTQNNTFEAGETITYKLYYNWNFVWLSAGEVTFNVKDEGAEYHISARGNTYKSYEWFYKVRDKYDSYISKETLLPRVHIKDVHEGGYRRYDKTTFDQNGKSASSFRGVTREEAKTETIDLEGCVHDIISSVYFMRNLDFENMNPGNEMPITIFMDRETYPLSVKYLGEEDNVKVKGMGRYNTYKLSPQLIAGEVFKEGDEMAVYVSRDQNKIPLLIESPVSVGSVKAVLKSYGGLKYDFTAKAN